MSFKNYITSQYIKEQETIDSATVIDIYFKDLDELIQKKIMEAVMNELNVAADDNYANKKIIEGFSKNALVTLTGKDITNKIKFEV